MKFPCATHLLNSNRMQFFLDRTPSALLMSQLYDFSYRVKKNGQPCPGAAGRTESMSMYDRRVENISGNAPGDNHHNHFSSKGGFCFRKLLLILLLILLLPLSSVAENLTCSRLPMLMEMFLDNHYAMKDMTGEINTHAVNQMIKSLDNHIKGTSKV